MRIDARILLLTLSLTVALAAAQTNTTQSEATQPSAATAPAANSKEILRPSKEKHISAPVAIHTVDAEFSEEARGARYSVECIVELIVDKDGVPRNVHVSRPVGMGLDENAIAAVKQFRFKPALKDGTTSVAVYYAVAIDFILGPSIFYDHVIPTIHTDSLTTQVKPPVFAKTKNPSYTSGARKRKVAGKCVLSLTVDEKGLPQGIQLKQSLDPELDAEALKAASKCKFKPATLNGTVVAVPITLEFEFRL